MKNPTEKQVFTKYLRVLECNNEKNFILATLGRMKKDNVYPSKEEFKKYIKIHFEEIGLYDTAPNLDKDFRENEIQKLINRIANHIEGKMERRKKMLNLDSYF